MKKLILTIAVYLLASSVMGGNVTLRGTSDCDDTYVNSEFATLNYGITPSIVGGASDSGKQFLFRFDLSGIPATATVDSAYLFFVNISANQTWKIGRTVTRWVEGTENGSNPGGGPEYGATWQFANDSGATEIDWANLSNWSTQDLDSNSNSWYASAVSESGTGYIQFYGGSGSNLVTLIQNWVDGTWDNYGGWLGKPNTTEAPRTVRASEYATEAQRPLLYVEYTPAGVSEDNRRRRILLGD